MCGLRERERERENERERESVCVCGMKWLPSGRTAAAGFIILWAGALHWEMMKVQKQISTHNDKESNGTEKPRKTVTVELKLSGDLEE